MAGNRLIGRFRCDSFTGRYKDFGGNISEITIRVSGGLPLRFGILYAIANLFFCC